MSRRPTRFQLFLILSAALVGVVVAAASAAVGSLFERRHLANDHARTARVIQNQARQHLKPDDFTLAAAQARPELFREFLAELPGVVRLKVFDTDGRITWANEPRLIGRAFPDNPNLRRALAGEIVGTVGKPTRSEHLYERQWSHIAEVYVPVGFAGASGLAGVIEAYTDVTDLVAEVGRVQWLVWLLGGGAGALLWAVLALAVGRASAAERAAIAHLSRENETLTLLHRFTSSLLGPSEVAGVAARVVEGMIAALGLEGAVLRRVEHGRLADAVGQHGRTDGLGSASGAPLDVGPGSGTPVVRDGRVWMAVPPGGEPRYVVEGRLGRQAPVTREALPQVLEIMMHEAGVALARVEAHARLSAILSAVADGMMIIDREARVVWANAAATGRPDDDAGPLVGRPCHDVFGLAAGDCEACPAIRAFASGSVERGMRRLPGPDGQPRWFDLVAAPLRDAAGQIHQVLEVARDVTSLERANLELRELQAQLVERERLAAIGQVVVGLHHAILNPLAGVAGALQVLRQGGLDPDACRAVEAAEAELRRVESIVRALPGLRTAEQSLYVGETAMIDVARLATAPPATAVVARDVAGADNRAEAPRA